MITLIMRTILEIPDCIIWATARENGLFLVTRNQKDFKKTYSGIHIHYHFFCLALCSD
ncbi:MAG: DUF5615 family PIN-like protein [Leptospiraceae bacterium]|nr:DUF5615 family PIN-like protein [Leptospiraceae bacterium]